LKLPIGILEAYKCLPVPQLQHLTEKGPESMSIPHELRALRAFDDGLSPRPCPRASTPTRLWLLAYNREGWEDPLIDSGYAAIISQASLLDDERSP
ncbi:MAG: hypothetical protein K5989_11720, partial [Lachnospiraceae bacterium]|nr:hypothetical protein [Lachnospiraceae bacterium]